MSSPYSWRAAMTLAAILFLFASLPGCSGDSDEGVVYHCPMHPTYVSDEPGDCPICNMKLVPVEASGPVTSAPSGADHELRYHCPMHPTYVSDRPGECPICHMDLVQIEEPRASSPRGVAPPAGYSVVEASPEAVRLAGVQTTAAVHGTVERTVRAVGVIQPDETRVRQVNTRVSGWVEKLSVSFAGQFVRRGDPLLTVYSPELAASQEEYLRALEAVRRFERSDLPEVRAGAQDLVVAARNRLLLYDVPEELIREIERTGKGQHTVVLEAPSTGFATGKEIFAGARIEPGMTLFTIADLSRVWVKADVYEYEASMITHDSEALITLPYDASFSRAVRVSYIYPTVDPTTRTLQIRFDVPNPEMKLRPGMFANVEIRAAPDSGVVVPDDAILDSGTRKIVFVESADGRFEPREVAIGMRRGGRARVLSGVGVGELVVVRANFLLDSESRLRAAIAGFTGKRPDGEEPTSGAHGSHP